MAFPSPYAGLRMNFEFIPEYLVLLLRVWARMYCREQDGLLIFGEVIASV